MEKQNIFRLCNIIIYWLAISKNIFGFVNYIL